MRKDYFDEIFKSSKTVIIPGLGSFTKSDTDSKISFNPYLKFNDGFLAGFIAKKQDISIDDSGKSIADSVDKINLALMQKGEALVVGLGVLKKAPDGKITFTTDQHAESKTVDEPKKEIPPVVKAAEKTIDLPKVKEPEKPKEEPKKEPVIEKPVVKEEKPVVKQEKSHDIKISAPVLTTVEGESKKDKKKEKQVTKKEPKQPKPPREKGERKKRKIPIWFIAFIVIAMGGGTFAYLKWDMVKGWLGINKSHDTAVHKNIVKNKEKIKKEPVVPVEDTASTSSDTATAEEPLVEETKQEPVKEETPVKQTPIKETPVKETPIVNSPTGTFHVICGNFNSQDLANKMVEKLNSEGNQASNLGNRGGFFMVSAGSFSTLEEANAKREALKATHPKAYIYNGL